MHIFQKLLRSFTSTPSILSFQKNTVYPTVCQPWFTSIQKQRFPNSIGLISRFSHAATDSELVSHATPEVVDPLKHPDFFGVKKLVTVEDLFNARVHYGHKKGSRSEHMKPYLFGCRLGVDIIDLEQTLSHMQTALNFLAHIAYRKGCILFVMKSRQFGHIVEQLALDCGEYAHTRQWTQGTFTNAGAVWGQIRLPDVCVFLSVQGAPYTSHIGVAESAKVGIVSVGICDSNVNPTLISYPIPGNDDTPAAIELYCRLFKQAILLGKEKRKEFDEKQVEKN